jgi:TonB family protein
MEERMKSIVRLLFVMAAFAIFTVSIPSVSTAGEKDKIAPSSDEFVAVDVMPEMIDIQIPVYPEEARAKEIEGTVWIRALVAEDGTVTKARVHKPSGVKMLDESALKAAYKCTYKPAEQAGKPVAVWVTYKVAFNLDGSSQTGQELSISEPSPDDFVAVEVNPEMVYEQTPVYPKEAEDEGVQGVVWVKALVDTDGTVAKVTIGKSSGHKCLDKAALEAAHKCKYRPALAQGKPTATWISYKVDFTLAEKSEKSEHN